MRGEEAIALGLWDRQGCLPIVEDDLETDDEDLRYDSEVDGEVAGEAGEAGEAAGEADLNR
jgi:hypothetical protein